MGQDQRELMHDEARGGGGGGADTTIAPDTMT